MRISKPVNHGVLFIALLSPAFGTFVARADASSYEDDVAQLKVDNAQAIIDRKLYVSPASAKFKPRGTGTILELKLTFKTVKIKRGEPIRYRFEVINVGSEPFLFAETVQSFFKTGRIPSDAITMRIIDPRGRTESARSAFLPRAEAVNDDIQLPPGLSEKEREAKVKSMMRTDRSKARLFQRLAPGETLHTLADAESDGFRRLNVDAGFQQNGSYELYVVLDAFAKSERKSNHARIEIVP